MKICNGHIILRKQFKMNEKIANKKYASSICDICFDCLDLKESSMPSCLNEKCFSSCHLTCLAVSFTENGQYVPISGQCRSCQQLFLWGDLIRKRNGCSDSIILINDNDENNGTD